jgi:polar amino acid transport system permease protein
MPHFPSYVSGALVTLSISGAAILIGQFLGLSLGVLRTYGPSVLPPIIDVVSSIIKATPLLTLVLLIYFGLYTAGVDFSAVFTAVFAMAVNTAVQNADIWRAAFRTVGKDQIEAGRSVGMSRSTIFGSIVLRQAGVVALPALLNEITYLIKASPAIAVIGLVDLTRVAARQAAQTYRPLPAILFAFLCYFVILIAISLVGKFCENRTRQRGARG